MSDEPIGHEPPPVVAMGKEAIPDAGLRRRVMPTAELMAQAIANIAPSAVIAFIPATIFLTASNATWFTFVLATIVICCVGYCIVQFAKRRATAGSLYTYSSFGAGKFGAYITGVTLIIGCYGIAAGSLSGCVSYALLFLDHLGIHLSGLGIQIIFIIPIGALAAALTIWGVRTSARTALTLEIISITIITFVLVYALFKTSNPVIDKDQVSMKGAGSGGVAYGMVLAILGYVGFSSADALGREAANPFKAVPRAIMFSAIGVGLLYIFASYAQVVLLGKGLGSTGISPMDVIATDAGLPNWFKTILTFGIMASFFAVVIAPINVIGRIVYVMGKEGVAPGYVGRTHSEHLTPHRAIFPTAVAVIGLDIILYLAGGSLDEVLVWVDTFGTYGYMVAYAVVAVAAPIFLKRIGIINRFVYVTTTVTVLSMIYVFYKNVYPVPDWPLNVIPWAFFAVVLVAVGWYRYLQVKRPEAVDAIGTLETDVLEGT